MSQTITKIVKEKEKFIQKEQFTSERIASKAKAISSTNKSSDRVSKGLNMVKTIGEVGADIANVINTQKTNDAELKAIDSAIQTQENNVKQLKAFEMSLFTNVIPQIRQMGSNLRLAGENMKNQSQIALKIGKWKVQQLIQDLRLNLKKVSKYFHLQEDLLNIVDNLDGTMGLLVEVFDRIQVDK